MPELNSHYIVRVLHTEYTRYHIVTRPLELRVSTVEAHKRRNGDGRPAIRINKFCRLFVLIKKRFASRLIHFVIFRVLTFHTSIALNVCFITNLDFQ